MYKCTECGQIFETKPDYCDCGNNEFIEIAGIKAASAIKNDVYLPKITANKEEIISWSIFVLCILLSIFVWIFAWNDTPVQNTKKTTQQSTEKILIPDIDTIWNDESAAPEISAEQKKNEQPLNTSQQQVIRIIKNVIVQPDTKTQTSVKTELPKAVAPVKKTEPKINTSSVKTQVKEHKTKVPVPSKTQAQKAAEEELNNYKVSLRSALFSNLKVTSVKGEGRCEVSFSIDSTGKLVNRNFSKLSDNKSMNDAVYYMFMSLPQYYPPPKAYKGELFTMTFYINDGYYEINYK